MERCNIINDNSCIEQVKQIMESTPGFHDSTLCMTEEPSCWTMMGLYVNYERRKFESDSGISFPVIRKE